MFNGALGHATSLGRTKFEVIRQGINEIYKNAQEQK